MQDNLSSIERTYRAHILYAPVAVDDDCPYTTTDDPGPIVNDALQALEKCASYRVTRADYGDDAMPADVIIADCRASQMMIETVKARLAALRHRHGGAILLILIDPALPWTARLELKRYGTLCPIGVRGDLVVSRVERLLDNLALADECGERLKTLASLNRARLEDGILKASTKPLRVLVSGAPSPLTLRAMKSLMSGAFKVTAAISVPQTVRYLEMNIFDCLVLMPGARTATYTGLVKMLRRNDRTRALPILVIPERADDSARAASCRFMAQGADTVLDGEDAESALSNEVTAFARRNRLTVSMKQFLRKTASRDGTGENLVSDLGFFEHHLARLCARSGDNRKPLSLSAFRLTCTSGEPASSEGFQQALGYAQMIIRDTDMITAVRDDIFLVSQPGLPRLEAVSRQENIAEVLQQIVFEDRTGEPLSIQTSTVEYRPGDSAEDMIARAFRCFRTLESKVEAPRRPSLRVVQ